MKHRSQHKTIETILDAYISWQSNQCHAKPTPAASDLVSATIFVAAFCARGLFWSTIWLCTKIFRVNNGITTNSLLEWKMGGWEQQSKMTMLWRVWEDVQIYSIFDKPMQYHPWAWHNNTSKSNISEVKTCHYDSTVREMWWDCFRVSGLGVGWQNCPTFWCLRWEWELVMAVSKSLQSNQYEVKRKNIWWSWIKLHLHYVNALQHRRCAKKNAHKSAR